MSWKKYLGLSCLLCGASFAGTEPAYIDQYGHIHLANGGIVQNPNMAHGISGPSGMPDGWYIGPGGKLAYFGPGGAKNIYGFGIPGGPYGLPKNYGKGGAPPFGAMSGGPMPAPAYPPGGGIPGSGSPKSAPIHSAKPSQPNKDYSAPLDQWERGLVAKCNAWYAARNQDPRFKDAMTDVRAEYDRRVEFIGDLKNWYLENLEGGNSMTELKAEVDKVWNNEEKPRRQQAEADIYESIGMASTRHTPVRGRTSSRDLD